MSYNCLIEKEAMGMHQPSSWKEIDSQGFSPRFLLLSIELDESIFLRLNFHSGLILFINFVIWRSFSSTILFASSIVLDTCVTCSSMHDGLVIMDTIVAEKSDGVELIHSKLTSCELFDAKSILKMFFMEEFWNFPPLENLL